MTNTNNKEIYSKLLNTAKAYMSEVLKDFHNDSKINVYISGSVSYGFCDELSDIEMEFYFPKGTNPIVISEVEKAIESLPEFEGVRISAGKSEWPLEKIVSCDLDEFWKKFDPYDVYEIVHALAIREDILLIDNVKNIIAFYPKEIADRVVKGLWVSVVDSGVYNADYSLQRNQKFVSEILFFRAMEALLRLAYITNKQYYPHTKWLVRGLDFLDDNFGLKDFSQNYSNMNLEERIKGLGSIADTLSSQLVDTGMLDERYQDNAWDILEDDDYYIFSMFKGLKQT